MPLLPADESHLTFYFRAASLFQRSTFGAQLDRARSSLAGPRASWAWCPGDEGPPCHVSVAHEPSQGYEVDHRDLLRFSAVSRRMAAAARDESVYDTLAAYYGDRGARWQAAAVGRVDETTGAQVVPGYGPGAVAALFSMVPAGRALIARERLGPSGEARGKGRSDGIGAARRAVHAAEGARGEAVATLQAAMVASHEARQVGPVPAGQRAALHAARATVTATGAALDAARRRLGMLERPYQGPRLADVDTRPQGRDGPLLADGRWSPTDPAPMPRVAAAAGGGPSAHLTDDEVLEVVMVLEQVTPRPDRKRRIAEARDQAEALLVRAWEAWLRTGPPAGRRAGGRPRCPGVAMDARYARGGAAQW